ncbi:MAG: VCBS repeat-containing protein [Cyclobacteriaceae bacterium]
MNQRIFCLLLFSVFGYSCGNGKTDGENAEIITAEPIKPPIQKELTGAQLSRSYCSSCHLYPEPLLLDKKTWANYILPLMGNYYGIYSSDTTREFLIEGGRAGQFVEKMNIFPHQPTIDTAIFNKIKKHYLKEAPELLPKAPAKNITVGLKNFKVKRPSDKTKKPMTVMVKVAAPNEIYISDAGRSTLSIMDQNMKVLKTAPSPEGTVWIKKHENATFALVIGTFNPTDMNLGFVMELPSKPGQATKIPIKDLQRPVHLDVGDLDGDGMDDMVISEYGKQTGSLAWWKQEWSGQYRKKVLKNKPGATKAYIRDMNGNGKNDIIALMGQGDEGIFIFHNQGNSNFIEEKVLGFPPVYGSSYFNLYDFNGDGHEDIIYTAGDNADYDPIIKNYHGLRIFINDGSNHFKEEFFYQLNGAYKAIPQDFDGDGDVDIAAISFFPDYESSPEESFVYLENKGDFKFEAYTFEGSPEGRWMVMDVGDTDGDGDMDIILGSMVFGTDFTRYFNQWVEGHQPYVILENQMVK